jgi:hypothetical protein
MCTVPGRASPRSWETSVLTERSVTWEAVVAESGRRRRRRRGVASIALVVALGAGGLGVANRLGGSRSGTDIVAGPGGKATPPDARALAGGPVRSLGRLFDLPVCPGDGTGLAAWATAALAPSAALAAIEPADIAAVAEVVPVLRDAPPAGACVRGLTTGAVRAWELRTADGRLLGRGAGTPLTSPDVSTPRKGSGPYLQESLASGQGFGGTADGRRIDGSTSSEVIAVELAPDASVTGAAGGLDMLARLSLASVAPLAGDTPSLLPASAPGGFSRCTGDLAHLRGRPGGPEVELCDAAGRTITVSWAGVAFDPADSEFVDVNGTPGRVMALSGGRMGIVLDPAVPGGRHIQAETSWRAGTDQLVAMLRSVPAVDGRLLNPRAGSGDVQYLLTDPGRLRSLLEKAEATGVNAVRSEPCAVGVICAARAEATFLAPSGARTDLILFAGDLRRELFPDPTGVETVAGVDILQHSRGMSPHGPYPDDAIFLCGKVTFSMTGVGTLAFARALVPTLGC